MRLLTLFLLSVSTTLCAQNAVQLTLDTTEADQALRILHKQAAHKPVTNEDWNILFTTVPYQWLKAREESMHREFSDDDFKKFLLSPTAGAKTREWEQTLDAMKTADLAALGARVLEWLPPQATIHARVFPEIKPKTNSFVWHKDKEDPAIFLYLEQQTKAQFENTVAHECHHIGLGSLDAQQEAMLAKLPPNARKAAEWLGAFGEGEAMLAAAGSADLHPHWEDDAIKRARWDSDMAHFNQDLAAVQQMLLDILDAKLKTDEEIRQRADPFWGYQGAWYTVGYEMAALVEKQYGRKAFNECLLDPRQLLVKYNEIAKKANADGAQMATWSDDLLQKLDVKK